MTLRLKDYLECLNDIEVSSIRYEGVVGIRGNEVLQGGKVIDRLTTKAKAKVLFDELCEQEGVG